MPVHGVSFIADLPQKHRRSSESEEAPSTAGLRELIESARSEVLLQTPSLVLSQPAQQMFRDLQARDQPPQVVISTNSLASTDSFITYALSYKYKRRYLRDFGFRIHEFKPFPEDAPIDVDATGAVDIGWDAEGNPVLGPVEAANGRRAHAERVAVAPSGSSGARDGSTARPERALPLAREYSALRYAGLAANRPVPLERAGVRIGMHAKSLVVDERVGVVGTHNFDPRGDRYTTESAVVIADAGFARALAASIRRDIQPGNSWVIARRDKPPVFSGLEYSLAKVSEHLPVFDLWPVRYATSYEFVPGPACPEPLPPRDPGFRACHEPVGDFPEVRLGLKSLLTRIFTAFGAGLAPIL
jgi:cardiolipin synthase C